MEAKLKMKKILLNRCIAGLYPGSIYKILTAYALEILVLTIIKYILVQDLLSLVMKISLLEKNGHGNVNLFDAIKVL